MLWDARHFLEKIGAAQVPLKCIFIYFIKLFHTSLHIFEAIKHKTMSIKTFENHIGQTNQEGGDTCGNLHSTEPLKLAAAEPLQALRNILLHNTCSPASELQLENKSLTDTPEHITQIWIMTFCMGL